MEYMEHEFHQVDVLDDKGEIIGQKPRREIDKTSDIFHGVYVLLITPNKELVLDLIPLREDLPNLYANQYGPTMATIRRSQEMSRAAAKRGVSRELFIDDTEPELIGEAMERLSDGRWHFMSTYILRSEKPDAFSQIDIQRLEAMTKDEFQELLEAEPEKVAPTMQLIWQKYPNRLAL